MVGRAIPADEAVPNASHSSPLPPKAATKKIILFSDGTGNSSAKAEKTNVWRLFQALDQTNVDQLARYDDGVGTSSNRYLAALTGALGWGLKRNVLDLYKFVCRNYRPGDEIHGFGFSRGSFTIRVLVGLIANEGLVTFRSEEDLQRNAAAAYRHYRSEKFPSWSPIVLGLRWLRDRAFRVKDWIKGYSSYRQIRQDTARAGRAGIRIRFLGLWDTVEAYGMPIAELKRGIDWVLWPMMFGDLKLSPLVDRACHALSLDDERTTFHPLLWDEEAEAARVAAGEVPPGRLTQVWFAGVHSNVGGGYPQDQLSLVSLEWMMSEAVANGLALEPSAVEQVSLAKSPYARLYDSRAGLACYFRYAPRRIPVWTSGETEITPIVHGSVVLRMASGTDGYAPISLPPNFWVLAPDGELLAMQGFARPLRLDPTKTAFAGAGSVTRPTPEIAAAKAETQRAIVHLAHPDQDAVSLVWDTVWWRRILYFVTVALTGVLVAFPWFSGMFANLIQFLIGLIPVFGDDLARRYGQFVADTDTGTRGPISSLVDAVSMFIPSYAQLWTKELVSHPVEFGSVVVAILLGLYGGTMLQARIRDRARLAWHESLRPDYLVWQRESARGWRNGMLVAFVAALLALGLAAIYGGGELSWELAVVAAVFGALLAWRAAAAKMTSKRENQPPAHALPTTFSLSLARKIRHNPYADRIYQGISGVAVPIAFAIGLLVLGLFVANRAVFDALSAAGHYCNDPAKGAARTTFNTEDLCWASGVTVKEGRRYRVTLTTKGDWFDRTIRTDVEGFPAARLRHYAATLLKRWWGQSWFKPIVRIGELGNDEYPLDPIEPFDPHSYCTEPETWGGLPPTAKDHEIEEHLRAARPPSPGNVDDAATRARDACLACPKLETQTDGAGIAAKIREDDKKRLLACSPTPAPRKTLHAEFTARSSGEIFLYVNDAVLALPGLSNLFYRNNRGTATIAIERIPLRAAPN